MKFMTLSMNRFLIAAVFLCVVLIINKVVEIIKYQRYKNRFNELKQICKYLVMHRIDPVNAEEYKAKNIIVEREWLYTKNFFFNLNEKEEFKKVEVYYLEILKYFATCKRPCDKETCKKILDFRSVLDMLV